MKSQRLTNYIKDSIWELIYQGKVKTELDKIEEEKINLFKRIYLELYSVEDINLMANAPKDAFKFEDFMYVYLGGRKILCYFGAKVFHFHNSDNRNKFLADHKFSIEFDKLENKRKDINSFSHTLRNEVFAILNSVTTTKRLLEIWPESKHYLDKILIEEKVYLPALNISTLNKKLGL